MFHARRRSLCVFVGIGALIAACSSTEITVQGKPDELVLFDSTLHKHADGGIVSCHFRTRDIDKEKDEIRPCDGVTVEKVENLRVYGVTYGLSGHGASKVADVLKDVGLPFTTYYDSNAPDDPTYVFVACPTGCSLKCSWCTGITACKNPKTCVACR